MSRVILALWLTIGSAATVAPSSKTPIEPPDLGAGMQFQCLAITAYREAGNQGEIGMALVVHTILERSKQARFGNDYCVTAVKFYDGFRNWDPSELPWQKEPEVWEMAVRATEETLAGEIRFGACRGATHFYNPATARPYWRKKLEYRCTYKNHTFYHEDL